MLDARVSRLESALERLAEAQARTQEQLQALAASVDQLTRRVDQLVLRMDELTQRVDQLAQRMDELTQRVDQLAQRVDRLADVTAAMRGELLELRYREHAPSYFQHILRRIRLLPREALEALADDAEQRGQLTADEHRVLVRADVVVQGRVRDRPTEEAYLMAEVSSVVDSRDVERVAHRASLLHRATGVTVIAAVAGMGMTPEAERVAQRIGVRPVISAADHSQDI